MLPYMHLHGSKHSPPPICLTSPPNAATQQHPQAASAWECAERETLKFVDYKNTDLKNCTLSLKLMLAQKFQF